MRTASGLSSLFGFTVWVHQKTDKREYELHKTAVYGENTAVLVAVRKGENASGKGKENTHSVMDLSVC